MSIRIMVVLHRLQDIVLLICRKNSISWQLGIERVSRSASQYADRINQMMVGSNVNLSDVAAQFRGEYMEREQTYG